MDLHPFKKRRGRKKGIKKNPNSGRKKGTPNTGTIRFIEAIEAQGVNLPRAIINTVEQLEKIEKEEFLDVDKKLKIIQLKSYIYLSLLDYVYPKRKAIEEKAPVDSSREYQIDWADEAPARDALPAPIEVSGEVVESPPMDEGISYDDLNATHDEEEDSSPETDQ